MFQILPPYNQRRAKQKRNMTAVDVLPAMVI